MVRLHGPDWTWGGSWAGNDTLWRMVVDLNRILVFADKNGVMRWEPQRKLFHLVDGIVAGQGEGTLNPKPRTVGVTIAGVSAARVDAVMATVMGHDWRRTRTIRESLRLESNGPGSVGQPAAWVMSNDSGLCGPLGPAHRLFEFTPAGGWVGSVELRDPH